MGPWKSRKIDLDRGLGRSWGDLGSQELKKECDARSHRPIWPPNWRRKSIKNPSRGHRKGDCFFDHFWDRLLKRFGTNLAPKTIPKWSQINAKIDASWGVDFTLVLERILAPFLLIFDLNMPRLEYRKSIKNVELSPNLLVFRYCGCCAVELTLWLILDWFFEVLEVKNPSKIHPKSD